MTDLVRRGTSDYLGHRTDDIASAEDKLQGDWCDWNVFVDEDGLKKKSRGDWLKNSDRLSWEADGHLFGLDGLAD